MRYEVCTGPSRGAQVFKPLELPAAAGRSAICQAAFMILAKKIMATRGVPTLLGIPFDGYSSYLRGAGDAPAKIREALRCAASNSWSELGVGLGVVGVYEDAGDLQFSEVGAFAAIEAGVGALFDEGQRPVLLGGDHSSTYPIVKAVAGRHR